MATDARATLTLTSDSRAAITALDEIRQAAAAIVNAKMRETVESCFPGEEFSDDDLPRFVAGSSGDGTNGPS